MIEGDCSKGAAITLHLALKPDAVLGVLTKHKTFAETCHDFGISEQMPAR